MKADGRVNGKTRLTGLIGFPIAHSVSPQLHNTLSLLLHENIIYIPMKVPPEELPKAVSGLKSLGFSGFNVTIPYKASVMDYLDEISTEARLIGAVNTVKIENGIMKGFNTDAEGFAGAFRTETGTDFKGKNVVILGAGGTARTIAVKVVLEAAGRLSIINRTADKALRLAYDVMRIAGDTVNTTKPSEITGSGIMLPDIIAIIDSADIIINTTSSGMYPDTEDCPLPSEACILKHRQIVYDVIYNPAETQFLKMARSFGCTGVNGLGMLFRQGVAAHEIWTGRKITEETLIEAFTAFREIAANPPEGDE